MNMARPTVFWIAIALIVLAMSVLLRPVLLPFAVGTALVYLLACGLVWGPPALCDSEGSFQPKQRRRHNALRIGRGCPATAVSSGRGTTSRDLTRREGLTACRASEGFNSHIRVTTKLSHSRLHTEMSASDQPEPSS